MSDLDVLKAINFTATKAINFTATNIPSKVVTVIPFVKIKTAPIIVIDPGHGYTKESTGASSHIYKYKTQNEKGKLDGKTAQANIIELPKYVIEDLSLIVSVKEDQDRPERALVFDVSKKLKALLEAKGYKVLLTREQAKIEGSDNPQTRQARIKLANDNKADYFISIHADGAQGYKASGAHAIYPKVKDKNVVNLSYELAQDILGCYTIITKKKSPRQDEREIQVLKDSNKTTRKVLVELGFITSPEDAKLLFTNIDKIAMQLEQGLIENIDKYFKE